MIRSETLAVPRPVLPDGTARVKGNRSEMGSAPLDIEPCNALHEPKVTVAVQAGLGMWKLYRRVINLLLAKTLAAQGASPSRATETQLGPALSAMRRSPAVALRSKPRTIGPNTWIRRALHPSEQ